MAVTDAKDKKIVGAPFSNAEEIVRVIYDFDEDAGAVGRCFAAAG